jgi:hypothetical protein
VVRAGAAGAKVAAVTLPSASSAVGPLQLVLVGFETTENFRGDVVRELAALRGRGMIRVLDARFFRRDGERLTEIDLNPLLAEPPVEGGALAHLIGANGSGGNGVPPMPGLAGTVGFALEDVRRLAAEIGPGDHAAVVLVEHVWAGRLREAVFAAGGRLLGQGFLTPEVVMVVGAEIQARADAEAAIELAEAARGAALIEALQALGTVADSTAEERTRAAARVVRVLVETGFVAAADTAGAIDALVTAGLLEAALVEAAIVEAQDASDDGEPPGGES